MPRRAHAFALVFGALLAVVLGACGSDETDQSGATPAPPLATSSPATTSATAATTGTAASPPPAVTTAPSTTPTTSTQASGGATTTQPSGGASDGAAAGCPPLVGGFIRDVRASDCGVAREVASAWFAAVDGGAAPDGTIEAAGYRCSGTLAGERASVTCAGARGGVAFTASP